MEANDLDTIFNKTFHQLSESEKMDMKDLFTTEEEFLNMKFMLDAIQSNLNQQYEQIEPNSKIKTDLDHLFHQTHQSKGVLWYNTIPTFFISQEKQWHQQNLVRIAAVLAVLAITIPFWKSDLKTNEPLLSKLEQVQEEQKTPTKTSEIKATPEKSNSLVNASDSEEILETTKTFYTDIKMEEDLADDEMKIVESKSSFDEDKNLAEPSFSVAGTTFTGHPDGVFVGSNKDVNEGKNVFAIESQNNILDLLTPTF